MATSDDAPLPPGKLPADTLAALLKTLGARDPRVVVGPGIGLDAAVIDMGDRLLVAKTDPITFAADSIGWYAVQINANDIATTGATPRWFLATVLLPGGRADRAMARRIVDDLDAACAAIGASLVGGHTEITHGLDRPIVVGMMLGEVARDRLVTAAGARPGDAVVLTKGIAVEGTAILAREKPDRLVGLDERLIERCRRFLTDPGISVVRDAALAVQSCRVHAMHDPTEGGLSTGLVEMAQASGVGMLIDECAVPFFPETLEVCRVTGLDPWGLIASGALLIAVDPSDAGPVVSALGAGNVPATVVGQVTDRPGEVAVRTADGLAPLRRFEPDELARVFG
ncbi:MAG: hydrogenase expression protein [Candidatus Riflebacteria bacterium]|nr:hydrogenase expression protein [Candidatus Riflebacteria bacterium]